jgi:hypothetical protein
MLEIWRDIKNYEGIYEVSNLGRIKSISRNGTIKENRILKPNKVMGYSQVGLQKYGTRKYKKIHRLVAEAFIPNPENKKEVNHKDGNKTNNCVDNLEWVTTSENQLHSYYELKNNIKSVIQLSLNNEIIKEWESIAKVEQELKISNADICKCCKGKRKTAGGYKWRYKENIGGMILC